MTLLEVILAENKQGIQDGVLERSLAVEEGNERVGAAYNSKPVAFLPAARGKGRMLPVHRISEKLRVGGSTKLQGRQTDAELPEWVLWRAGWRLECIIEIQADLVCLFGGIVSWRLWTCAVTGVVLSHWKGLALDQQGRAFGDLFVVVCFAVAVPVMATFDAIAFVVMGSSAVLSEAVAFVCLCFEDYRSLL